MFSHLPHVVAQAPQCQSGVITFHNNLISFRRSACNPTAGRRAASSNAPPTARTDCRGRPDTWAESAKVAKMSVTLGSQPTPEGAPELPTTNAGTLEGHELHFVQPSSFLRPALSNRPSQLTEAQQRAAEKQAELDNDQRFALVSPVSGQSVAICR